MTLIKSVAEMRRLTEDHFAISENALNHLPPDGKPRLVIWPESPMYFSYGSDQLLRERIASFARQHRASVLLNSQEVAPNDGLYNSAVLINEEVGSSLNMIRFACCRLANMFQSRDGCRERVITAIVGDFTPGTVPSDAGWTDTRWSFHLHRVCLSGYRAKVHTGWCGRAHQYLQRWISWPHRSDPSAPGNAVFRAVENGRPVCGLRTPALLLTLGQTGGRRCHGDLSSRRQSLGHLSLSGWPNVLFVLR